MISENGSTKPRSRSSRRRQQRRKNKAKALAQQNNDKTETEGTVVETHHEGPLETAVADLSVGDDESLKITEISETSDSETLVCEKTGIVCEAESDSGAETPEAIEKPKLVSSKRAATNETPFQKKAKKKEALMQYFLPVYHNPRFLEVISEEGSDTSDKECKIGYNEVATYSQEILPESDASVEVVFLPDGSSNETDASTDLSDSDEESNGMEILPSTISDLIENKRNQIEETTEKTIALSPSRSPSLSSNGSSSRATSLCTARYNPSIGDIASLAKDEQLAQSLSNLNQPVALRSLCINYLLSQPFGTDVLKELAIVSKVIDEFTSNLPSKVVRSLLKDNVKQLTYPPFLSRLAHGDNETFNIPVNLIQKKSTDSNKSTDESKAGQQQVIKMNDQVEAEEKKDLYLYYEENKNPAVANRDRLQAKELSEWLELARNKSVSESNLTTCGKTNQLMKISHDKQQQRLDHARRASLPSNFYQQQMFLIREKEREIQRQLEELEEEKRKLSSQMMREFTPEDYIISSKGDIAIYNENKKQFNSLATPTEAETFRQQMYDEYMQQIAERDDRRMNKVIKLSAPRNSNEHSPKESTFEATHVPDIEDEFMEQVKKRKLGGGGHNKDDSDEISSGIFDDETSEPIIVLDGCSVSSAKNLPRHLQEFAEGESW